MHGPELTTVEDDSGRGDLGEEWPGLDDEKAWLEKVEAEKDFLAKQLTFVEVLENRGGTAVVEAIGRIGCEVDLPGPPVDAASLGSGGWLATAGAIVE